MEELVDAVTGGAVWGLGFGVAALLVRGVGAGLRPVAKSAVKGAITVGDWARGATEETRETLQDLYAEAKAEHHGGNGQPSAKVESRA